MIARTGVAIIISIVPLRPRPILLLRLLTAFLFIPIYLFNAKLLLMLGLTHKDIRVILYALTVVKNWHGRFEYEAEFLADKIRWLSNPITTFSQFKALFK